MCYSLFEYLEAGYELYAVGVGTCTHFNIFLLSTCIEMTANFAERLEVKDSLGSDRTWNTVGAPDLFSIFHFQCLGLKGKKYSITN